MFWQGQPEHGGGAGEPREERSCFVRWVLLCVPRQLSWCEAARDPDGDSQPRDCRAEALYCTTFSIHM